MNKYKRQARKLLKAGFWMAGRGHFDLSSNELAAVLELTEKEDVQSLKALYLLLRDKAYED